jgi:hypothetical protein
MKTVQWLRERFYIPKLRLNLTCLFDMPSGTRRALRRQVTRANRRRQWVRELKQWRAFEHVAHKRTIEILDTRTLVATKENRGYVCRYIKTYNGWSLQSAAKELEFLRYCGKPEDARRALETRGFTWRWS